MTKKSHKNKDKKIFSLSIQDLKDLGIIKSKKKRKHKRNKKSSTYEMGGMKSESNQMLGYQNAFNPLMNFRNDTEYQVNKLLETKGIKPDNLRTNKIDVPMITNGNDSDDDKIRPNKYLTIEDGNTFYNWIDERFKNLGGNKNIDVDDDDDADNENYDNYDNINSMNNIDDDSYIDPFKMYDRNDNSGAFGATNGSDFFRTEGETVNQLDETYTTPSKPLFLPYYNDDGKIWLDNPLKTATKAPKETPNEIPKETPKETPIETPKPPVKPDVVVEDVEEEKPPKPNSKVIDITNAPEPPRLTRYKVKTVLDEYNNVDGKGKRRTKEETVNIYKKLKNILGEPILNDELNVKHPAQLNSINRELAKKLKTKYESQKK